MANKQEVYIVLTGTGTWLSRLIGCYTRAPLNHASIALDRSLREVYSFGRKKTTQPFSGGFVQEDFYGDPLYRRADCAVYRCRVSADAFRAIQERIDRMMREQHRYKYHVLGLLGVVLGRKFAKTDAYFCSHFVASVLEEAGVKAVRKPAHFVTPGDFAESPFVEEVYRGEVTRYVSGRARPHPAASSAARPQAVPAVKRSSLREAAG